MSYFLTVLLSGLLVFGGLGLLIIPGILIAFFFAFVAFEIVVESQSGWNALKRSYFMVKNNFWEILGRLLFLEAIALIIAFLFSSLARNGINLFGIQLLFSFFASWYAKSYVFLLYKEVRAQTAFPSTISLRWIPVVSVIGWVVIILLGIALANGLMHLPAQPLHLHRIPKSAA